MFKKYHVWVWMLVAGLALCLGVLTGRWWAQEDAYAFHGTLLDHPRTLPSFELVATDGHPFNHQYLQGHWTLMFFGFSQCASICPVTMAELNKFYKLVEEQSGVPLPQVVMITLDPEHDNLARMATYVHAFNPHFIGASGSLQAVKSLARDMGIAATRIVPDVKKAHLYTIEHSGAIMLINPKEELVAFFTPPHDAAFIASDYRFLMTH